jgi:hypothetical protein
MKIPNGKLRFIQAFVCGPICDCCECMGRSLAFFADDDHAGFALSRKCADKLNALEEYNKYALAVNTLDTGASFKIPVPKWKKGSENEFRLDMPVLLQALGAHKKFFVSVVGNAIEVKAWSGADAKANWPALCC